MHRGRSVWRCGGRRDLDRRRCRPDWSARQFANAGEGRRGRLTLVYRRNVRRRRRRRLLLLLRKRPAVDTPDHVVPLRTEKRSRAGTSATANPSDQARRTACGPKPAPSNAGRGGALGGAGGGRRRGQLGFYETTFLAWPSPLLASSDQVLSGFVIISEAPTVAESVGSTMSIVSLRSTPSPSFWSAKTEIFVPSSTWTGPTGKAAPQSPPKS